MGGNKDTNKTSTISDEIENLFDLVKEGASYILHIVLFFLSKTVPLEFADKLFDSHKDKSSYDFSKDGKTYFYRLTDCIMQVEKHLLGMGLEYLYNTIPLPFMKKLYENFCVNNNLKCTDVKLKKCKKALKESNKSNSNSKNEDAIEDQTKDDSTTDDAGESPAPVAKKLPPKTFEQVIEQNQRDAQKNLENFGKSIEKALSGGIQPLPPLLPPPPFQSPTPTTTS